MSKSAKAKPLTALQKHLRQIRIIAQAPARTGHSRRDAIARYVIKHVRGKDATALMAHVKRGTHLHRDVSARLSPGWAPKIRSVLKIAKTDGWRSGGLIQQLLARHQTGGATSWVHGLSKSEIREVQGHVKNWWVEARLKERSNTSKSMAALRKALRAARRSFSPQKALRTEDARVQGKLVEPLAIERTVRDKKKAGFTHFYASRKAAPYDGRQPRGTKPFSGEFKKVFSHGSARPDLIAVNHTEKVIFVLDPTSSERSLSDLPAGEQRHPNDAPAELNKRHHIEKTIADGERFGKALIRDKASEKNQLAKYHGYKIYVQDIYHSSGHPSSKAILIYNNGRLVGPGHRVTVPKLPPSKKGVTPRARGKQKRKGTSETVYGTRGTSNSGKKGPAPPTKPTVRQRASTRPRTPRPKRGGMARGAAGVAGGLASEVKAKLKSNIQAHEAKKAQARLKHLLPVINALRDQGYHVRVDVLVEVPKRIDVLGEDPQFTYFVDISLDYHRDPLVLSGQIRRTQEYRRPGYSPVGGGIRLPGKIGVAPSKPPRKGYKRASYVFATLPPRLRMPGYGGGYLTPEQRRRRGILPADRCIE